MIGQYLPQTNESATVSKTQKFCQLNKAIWNWGSTPARRVGEALSSRLAEYWLQDATHTSDRESPSLLRSPVRHCGSTVATKETCPEFSCNWCIISWAGAPLLDPTISSMTVDSRTARQFDGCSCSHHPLTTQMQIIDDAYTWSVLSPSPLCLSPSLFFCVK